MKRRLALVQTPRVCLTITLRYYLSHRIQYFFCTADYELRFDDENSEGTKRLEVILHPATGRDTTRNSKFRQVPKRKAKYGNKAVKYLRVKV